MLRLFVVRHGETKFNIEHRIQGWCDSPLTTKGIEQAKALSNELKEVDFTAVYASPLKRAMDTATLLLGNRTQEITLLNDLKELHFGTIEGEEDYKYIAKDGSSHREGFEKYGGETIAILKKRLMQAMHFITSNHEEGNILIVSHGAAIRYLLQEVMHSEDDYFIENCEVTYIDYENGIFKCDEVKQIKGF